MIMVRLLKNEKWECMMLLVKPKQNLRFFSCATPFTFKSFYSILDECHFASAVAISRLPLVIDKFCILLMQIVGYEEDLSGRQMLIDRVLTRSSMQ